MSPLIILGVVLLLGLPSIFSTTNNFLDGHNGDNLSSSNELTATKNSSFKTKVMDSLRLATHLNESSSKNIESSGITSFNANKLKTIENILVKPENETANSLKSETLKNIGEKLLRIIHLTAIHVDNAEFPLSRLLFKLNLRLALDSVNKHLEQEHRVKLVLSVRSANTCSRQFAGAIAAEEYYIKRARLFIVSGCDDAISAVSRLASQWQVPTMTAAGFGAELNDKSVHKTLIRVAFSLQVAVEFLFKIMKSFQWSRVNLLVDESDPNSLALRGRIEKHLLGFNTQTDSSANYSTYEHDNQNLIRLNTISLDFQSLMSQMSLESELQSNATSLDVLKNMTIFLNRNSASINMINADLDSDAWPSKLLERAIGDALRECSFYSRVTVLLIPQKYLRKFMLSVYDHNMANGLYTFINMPLISTANSIDQDTKVGSSQAKQAASFLMSTGQNVFLWRSSRSKRNAQAKQAFESLTSIYLKTPTTKAYVYYTNQLNVLANNEFATTSTTIAPPSSGRSNQQMTRDELGSKTASKIPQLSINPYVASFYDSVQIYAKALGKSLSEMRAYRALNNLTSSPTLPFNLSSNLMTKRFNLHANVVEQIKGRRFDDMVTGQIVINSNGDRETDYTLDDMNQMTGMFSPVILYHGERRSIERIGRIQWSSDPTIGPTIDNVDCNLTNSCLNKPITKFTYVVTLIAGPIALIIGSLMYFAYTRLSLESKLVDYWWKIHLNEIELVLTRRKNANDGSLVMSPTAAGDGAGTQASGIGVGHTIRTGSISSHHSSPRPVGPSSECGSGAGQGGGGPRMMISAGGRFHQASTVVTGASNPSGRCDKTEITKVTKLTDTSVGQWGHSSSAADVCYGNITLGMYKLAKVALKPIGIIVDEGSWAIVSEFCPKGSLREFFHNESMVIDWTFKYSIINDIIAGLNYLNSSPLGYHGRLKSSNCLVSARFVVKLSDYGPHSLYEQWDHSSWTHRFAKSFSTDENSNKEDNAKNLANIKWSSNEKIAKETELLKKRIWLAPEHMSSSCKRIGSMKGDIYSFGLLLYEIVTNNLPFFDLDKNDYTMPLSSLYEELKSHGPSETTGPNIDNIVLSDGTQNIEPLVDLMRSCWHHDPGKRPNLQMINTTLKKITRGVTSKKLLENLTTRMEQYTNNLEFLVESKLATLVEEKLKTEELLYQFVPKSIAALLKDGQFVEPEAFECVTVFYSDIVGFTSLSSESSPMEVVDFLSDLYLCFDETLERHDIFKVETIGDAYIVASGLPQRNGGKHVIEIATAALEIRDRLRVFKIPHKPGRSLEMRVGIHSGPCIAGIVGGLNMPKYCVFGDTLSVGKFMESTGLPMKIHITEESRSLLIGIESFAIEPRQPKIVRDGLPFQTYWLENRGL